MSDSVTEYKVFIASPGDLQEERKIVRKICKTLNNDTLVKDKKIRLDPVGWEDAFPEAGRPQAIINKLQKECDIFICMLHKRYGTPTGKYDSGTEEEFLNAYDNWADISRPRIMFYFKDVNISSLDDLKDPQLSKVFKLKDKIKSNEMLFYGSFQNSPDLEKILTEDLKKLIIKISKQKNTGDIPKVKAETKMIIPDQYKKWVLDITKNMDIDLLRGDERIVNVSLPELYQPLYTDNPEKPKTDKNLHETENIIDIEELAAKSDYLVVQGAAGCGKTTLMKHLLRTIINNKTKLFKRNSLPIILFMKDFKDYPCDKSNQANKVDWFLKWHIENIVDNGLNFKLINKFCENGKAVFLIDGLDEADTKIRELIVNSFADFLHKYKNNKIILAGRPHGVTGAAENRFGEKIAKVNSLTNEQVNNFINKWFEAVYDKDSGTGHKIARKMRSEIKAKEDIDELKQNPLMLTAMCILYHDLKELPDQRAELYERFIKRLFSKFGNEKNRVYSFMMELAHNSFIETSRGIDELEAVKILKKYFKESDEPYREKFQKIESGSGLMHFENGQYIFSHQTFQEFLTAAYLYDNSEDSPYDAIAQFIDNKRFCEVVELFIGYLSIRNKSGANAIVRKVLDGEPGPGFYRWIVVAKALLDIHKDNRKDDVCDLAKDRMLTILRTGETPGILNKAGENLGRLGYDRGYTDFVKIQKGDYDLEDIGIKPIPSFEISKYPVTNLWYKKFIDAGGYNSDKYFTIQGKKWFKKIKPSFPGFWHERKYNCPNSPVVGVSWYEADAFCRWLTKTCKDGYEYRLPREFEWQAAAAGKEKREYPWGKGIDPNKCNYDETEIGRISPVGIFKDGKTPEHVYDMAGNVWEWTCSFYDADKDTYVLRGGSFFYISYYCRCADRNDFNPFNSSNNIGFRCARIKL